MSTEVMGRGGQQPESDRVWSIETNGINPIPTLISYASLVGWETILVALASLGVNGILHRLGWGGGKATLAVSFVVVAAATIAIGLLGHATIVKIQTWFTWTFAVLTIFF